MMETYSRQSRLLNRGPLERYKPNRPHELPLHLDPVDAPAETKIWTRLPTPESSVVVESKPARTNGYSAFHPLTPPETLESPHSEADPLLTVRSAFDTHLRRLARLQAGLRRAPAQPEALETGDCTPIKLSPQRKHKSHAQPPLLRETLVYLDGLSIRRSFPHRAR